MVEEEKRMKKFVPTLLLVIVCMGAFWYASSKDFFREKKVEPTTLASVKKEDVQTIGIQTPENLVELARKGNSWVMTKPAALPLNSNLVESWIDSYGLLTSEKVIEDNASDLGKYGLDKPVEVYKATLKDGSVKTIQVGEALPVQGYFYAKVEGSSAVYQVGEQALSGLKKAPLDFMDTAPLKFDNDKVQTAKITWKGQTWTLTKTDKDKPASGAAWKLGDKELKGEDAAPLLDKLTFLHTAELAKPSKDAAMTAPELQVELTMADNAKDTYQGKLEQDKLWLVKQSGEWAYALAAADIQALADAFTEKSK
jgi:hypothetical protein